MGKYVNFFSIVFLMTSEYEHTHTFVICFFFGVIFILFYAVEIMSVFFTVIIFNSLYRNVNMNQI